MNGFGLKTYRYFYFFLTPSSSSEPSPGLLDIINFPFFADVLKVSFVESITLSSPNQSPQQIKFQKLKYDFARHICSHTPLTFTNKPSINSIGIYFHVKWRRNGITSLYV